MINKPDKIITHTAQSAKSHTAQDVHEWHKARWNKYNPSPYFQANNGEPFYAGYHFIIEWDGTIVQTRLITEEGVHCYGQNFSSIGVCFMGDGDKHYPSKEQKRAWLKLFERINKEYPQITTNRIYPHRKYANKSCHGALLDDDYYITVLGEERKIAIQELIEQVKQLQNRLFAWVSGRRMR